MTKPRHAIDEVSPLGELEALEEELRGNLLQSLLAALSRVAERQAAAPQTASQEQAERDRLEAAQRHREQLRLERLRCVEAETEAFNRGSPYWQPPQAQAHVSQDNLRDRLGGPEVAAELAAFLGRSQHLRVSS